MLPVPDDVRHWHASPRAAVGFLLHAAAIDTGALGDRRCLTMPGVSVTVAEQIAALRRVAGDEAVRRIRREPDETVHADRRGLAAQLRRAARARARVPRGGELRRDHPRPRRGRARRPDPRGELVTGIALVTGAGSGIGRAAAIALARRGLHGRARRPAAASRSRRRRRRQAATRSPSTCDVRDPESVAALFAEIDARFGRLDLLFNNAGVGAPPVPLEDLDARAVERRSSRRTSPARSCARRRRSGS